MSAFASWKDQDVATVPLVLQSRSLKHCLIHTDLLQPLDYGLLLCDMCICPLPCCNTVLLKHHGVATHILKVAGPTAVCRSAVGLVVTLAQCWLRLLPVAWAYAFP